MEIAPNSIISSESFDKYGLNDRCRVSKERVEDFVARGLMSQESVYQRYTEELSEKLTSLRRADQPTVIEDIRQSFHRLCDPDTGYLSEVLFKRHIRDSLPGTLDGPQDLPTLLFKIFTWHAFFPFPAPTAKPGPAQITESGFVRAICLLTLGSGHRSTTNPHIASHRCSSGTWGPHSGWYISLRGRDASDFRRRVFRSLGVRDASRSSSSSSSSSSDTVISIPRFTWHETEKEDPGDDDDWQQFFVVESETETSVDVVDVLSECPPETVVLTANPFRESYRVALPGLPKQTDDLSVLIAPTADVVALVKLVQAVQRGDTAGLLTAVEHAGSDGKIGWEEFDTVMSQHTNLITDTLSSIFGSFAAPAPVTQNSA